MTMTVGRRIRDARQALELSQRQLAQKAALTPSLLSQIEHDRVSPSLTTLRKLAAALGTPVSRFFDEPLEGAIKIVHKNQHARLTFDGSSERWTILAAGLVRGKIRAAVAELGPGEPSGSDDKIVVEPGQMKLCYMLQGEIDLHYGGQTYRMAAGDSAYVDGGVDHRWSNPGQQLAKVLWVITGTA